MAKSVVINGVTYSDVPQVEIPLSGGGGNAVFYDPSDADAAAGNVLTGKTFYKTGGKTNGSMPNNGDTSGTISTKAGTVTVPEGYTSGGTVSIDSTEQGKIVSGITVRHQLANENISTHLRARTNGKHQALIFARVSE